MDFLAFYAILFANISVKFGDKLTRNRSFLQEIVDILCNDMFNKVNLGKLLETVMDIVRFDSDGLTSGAKAARI